jgi:hypothetical protein
MPESGLDLWRWVNDQNRDVSVYVDDALVGNPNPDFHVGFYARPDAKFIVRERFGMYGGEIGAYAISEVPILEGRVADFCWRP